MKSSIVIIKEPLRGILNLSGKTEEVYRKGKGSYYFKFDSSNYRWMLDDEDALHFWETDGTPIDTEDLIYTTLCDLWGNALNPCITYV